MTHSCINSSDGSSGQTNRTQCKLVDLDDSHANPKGWHFETPTTDGRIETGNRALPDEEQQGPRQPQPELQDQANLDSGYAWLIMFVLFLTSANVGGSIRVYGLIYAKQVATGYYSREEADWPMTLMSVVENLAALLTPALVKFLTWRQIQLLSTSLFVLGNLGAYFSSSLPVDILCLGVVLGLGMSISTVLGLVLNNDYFSRFRNTAYGVSLSGSTFGILYLSPIIDWTLNRDELEFRSGYLILAIAMGSNSLLSVFIKPRNQTKSFLNQCTATAHHGALVSSKPELAGQATNKGPQPEGGGARVERQMSLIERHLERKSSVASIALMCNQTRQSNLQSSTRLRKSPSQLPVQSQQPPQQKISVFSIESGFSGSEERKVPASLEKKISVASFATNRSLNSTSNMDLERRQQGVQCPTSGDMDNKHQDTKAFDENESEQISVRLVLALLKTPYLHCVWIMLSIYYLTSRTFIIILLDLAKDDGLDEEQSLDLLKFWSLGELFGRIVLCSFVDLKWLSVRNCIMLTCCTMATSIGSMTFIRSSFYLYAISTGSVAGLISLEYVLINVLMIEYLGKNLVPSCYSLGSLISSLALLARPILIGLFRDQLGSYNGLLLLLASLSLIYGVLFGLLEPLMVRYWPKRQLLSHQHHQADVGPQTNQATEKKKKKKQQQQANS